MSKNELVDIRNYMNLEQYNGNDCVESPIHLAFKNNKRYLSGKWEHYLSIYDRIFAPYILKNKPISFLEVGILNGGSLEVWQNILPPKSKIIGVDITQACKDFKYNENIQVLIGDISKGELVDKELAETTFDIIIDDASHFCDNVITNFHKLFDKLNWGGIYIIEDCSTSYWNYYGGEYKDPNSSIEYFKNLADIVNYTYIDKERIPLQNRAIFKKLSKEIASVSFYDSVIVIEKYTQQKEKAFRNYVSGTEGLVAPKQQLLDYGHIECNENTKFERFFTPFRSESDSNTNVNLTNVVKEDIKFSLLIPTKNRLDLLKYALNSIFIQSYTNWEIIISDNCSDIDIKSYIDELNDKRITFVRQENPISVTENWNVTNNLANGDYIIMLGDDDALLPWTLEKLYQNIKKYNSPEVLNFSAYIYQQANVSQKQPKAKVDIASQYYPFLQTSSSYFLPIDTRIKFAQKSLDFEFSFGFNMQFFCYSKEIVKNLKKYGKFYEAPYPDYYTANALMLIAKEVLIIPEDLVIIGVTPKSYGAYYQNNNEKEGMVFHNESEYRKNALKSVRDKLCNIAEMQTAAMATFAILARRFPQFVNLNFNAYYNAVIDRIINDYPKEEAFSILKNELLPLLDEEEQEQYKTKINTKFTHKANNIEHPQNYINAQNIEELIQEIIEKKNITNNSIEVVYLARGVDYGLKGAVEFLQSYLNHSAGIIHSLHIIAKGWEKKKEEYLQLIDLCKELNIPLVDLPDDGFDLGAYYRAAKNLNGKHICFLSSSTIIEKDNWLIKLYNAIDEKTKLVAPFASYQESPIREEYMLHELQQIYPNVQSKDDLKYKVYRELNKKYTKNPLPFPNPHLRSNGFLIERELFIEFMEQNKIPNFIPRYKVEAWDLESGHNSLTRFILNKGFNAILVGFDGNYNINNWAKANTFRWFDTSNALISDMESRRFHTSIFQEQLDLIGGTWGPSKYNEIKQFEKDLPIKLFVVYNKESYIFSNDLLLPIQTGTENAGFSLSTLHDNVGNNISTKNPHYGELTAHYWVWKNFLSYSPQTEYIGFAHYRRFLDFDSNTKAKVNGSEVYTHVTLESLIQSITKNYRAQNVFNEVKEYDIILPRVNDFVKRSILKQYEDSNHPLEELNKFFVLLLKKHPEYQDALNKVFAGSKLYLSTIVIMKRHLFEEFCQWIFPLLFELEQQSDWSKYLGTYNQRIPAFLHERFFNVWLVHKLKQEPLKILEKECLMFGEANNTENFDKDL